MCVALKGEVVYFASPRKTKADKKVPLALGDSLSRVLTCHLLSNCFSKTALGQGEVCGEVKKEKTDPLWKTCSQEGRGGNRLFPQPLPWPRTELHCPLVLTAP